MMEAPPSTPPSKTRVGRAHHNDASWRNHVKKLLESPPEIDFRDKRWKETVPKMVPSGEQCRYLWRFYRNSRNDQQHSINSMDTGKINETVLNSNDRVTTKGTSESRSATITKDEPTPSESVDGIHATATLAEERQACLVASVSSQTSTAAHKRGVSLNQHSTKSENVASTPSRKRQRPSVCSDSGWISKSTFYKDSQEDNGSSNKDGNDRSKEDTTRLGQGQRTPARSMSIDDPAAEFGGVDLKCSERARKPTNLLQDDSPLDSPSPERRINSKRRKRLFRPTAKRADQRLKQKSLKQLFGTSMSYP